MNKNDKKRINNSDNDIQPNKMRTAIISTIVVCIILVCGIFGGFYIGFVHSCNSIAKKAVAIYESGTGEDLKELIAPGYVKHCEETFSSMSVAGMQQSHINDFRSLVYDKVGEVKSIKAERDAILTISNVSDLAGEFAEYGVNGVTKYRCVKMTWHVVGDKGETDAKANVYVLKCDDGWYLDFVEFESEAK